MRRSQHLAVLLMRLAVSVVGVVLVLAHVRGAYAPVAIGLPGVLQPDLAASPATTTTFQLTDLRSYAGELAGSFRDLQDALTLTH